MVVFKGAEVIACEAWAADGSVASITLVGRLLVQHVKPWE